MATKFFSINTDIDSDLESRFLNFIYSVTGNCPEDSIIIVINSVGGCFDCGISIYNILKTIPNPVYTIITRKAYSAASIVFLAAKPENRFTLQNSEILFHPVMLGRIENARKNILQKRINELDKNNELLLKIIKESTKIPEDLLNKLFNSSDNEELIYKSEEMEEIGIAKIVTSLNDIYKESNFKNEIQSISQKIINTFK